MLEVILPFAFVAGLLTVLAPCTLTLLPITLGGSVGGSKWKPLIVSLSLGVSVILFTLLIKMGGALLDLDGDLISDVPENALRIFSGAIIILFSLTMLWPNLWTKIAVALKLYKSDELIGKSSKVDGFWGSVLLGFALGPVFNSCSPTYILILSVVLPAKMSVGILALLAYTLGLVLFLLVIGYGGRTVVNKLRFMANPNGWFKKVLGILLLLVGVMIIFQWDKLFADWIIQAAGKNGSEIFNLECLVLDCDQAHSSLAEQLSQ